MSRMSHAVRSQYKRLEPRIEGMCYYCDTDEATMDDTTPSHKADASLLTLFPEEWTIAKCCQRCWSKIDKVNLVKGAYGYGGLRGLMTVAQKKEMLRGAGALVPVSAKFGGLVHNRDLNLIVPADLMIGENGSMYLEVHRIYEEEIQCLQWPFAMKLLKLDHLIPMAFKRLLSTGEELEISKVHVYAQMMGIKESDLLGEIKDDDDDEPTETYEQWLARQEAQAGEPDVESDGKQGDGA